MKILFQLKFVAIILEKLRPNEERNNYNNDEEDESYDLAHLLKYGPQF